MRNDKFTNNMILLHQLWNQRRQNLWIFIELLIAGFFLWMVIDPIYVLTSNRLIPQGGDMRGMYVVQLGQYDDSFAQYDPAQDSADVMRSHYLDIIRAVRTCPEVESVSLSGPASFPNAAGWNGGQLFNADTVMVHVQQYSFFPVEHSDLPQTYGMTDACTGKRIILPADFATRNMIAISERTARDLFGTVDAVGRTVYGSPDLKYPREVAAVFRNYKHFSSEQPYPLVVTASQPRWEGLVTWSCFIVFRLRDGVDADAFEARFQEEVAPHLSQGNLYYDGIQAFDEYSRQQALSSGVTNKLRLQYALGSFALLCIFLGMAGTFWIRANARREEIGIRRSMGASQGRITRQFLTEGAVLVTVAYALALLVVVNYVAVAGFAEGISAVGFITKNLVPDPAYAQNRPVPHFLWVTALTYVVLLLTALIGTWIPVQRAARTLPVEALHEE